MQMVIILQFLKDHWKVVSVSFLAVALAAYIGFLRLDIANDETTIAKQESEIVTLKNNNATLEAAIKTANDALDKSQTAANTANANMGTLGKKIQQEANNLNHNLGTITLNGAPTTCDATISYLIDATKGYPK